MGKIRTNPSPIGMPAIPIPYPVISMSPHKTSFKKIHLQCSMQGCNKSATCTLPKTGTRVCTDCYKEQTGGYALPSSSSNIKRSTGDEAGTTRGVASGIIVGPDKFSLMNQHQGHFLSPSHTKVMVMD